MTHAAAVYCAQVNKCLTCPGSIKRSFLRQLRSEAELYCEDHETQDVQCLYDAFGAPETVAESFLSELSEKTVSNCIGRRRAILIASNAVILIATAAAGVLGLQSRSLQKMIDDGFSASVIYKEEVERKAFWIPFQEDIFGHTDVIG